MRTDEAIEVFLLSRRARGLSPQTILWYQGILRHFNCHFRKLPRHAPDIEAYFITLTPGDERRHGYYRTLRCFYRFLNRRYKVTNPFDLIDPPIRKKKQPPILTPEEINQLLNTAPGELKAALLFLIDTGARLGEYARVSLSDLQETPAGFVCTITGKTGMRIVPISYETYHALMVTPRWEHSVGWLSRRISRAFKVAGLRGSAHTLRHTFATLWQGDELILQQIMGHSNLETTKHYRQLRNEALIKAHNVYSPLKMILSSTKSML